MGIEVHGGGGGINEVPLLDVAHDSDHLPKHRLRQRGQSGAAPYRIISSPIQLRGVPADEQHLRVTGDDVASPQHWTPHGTQVAWRDLPNLHGHRVALRRVSLKVESL